MKASLGNRLRGRSPAQIARLVAKTLHHHARILSPAARAQAHADRAFDRRWGTDTSDLVEISGLGFDADRAGRAVRYQPSGADALDAPLAALGIVPAEWDFVDYGGRMVMVAAQRGFRSSTGVELSAALCAVARRNLAIFAAACRVSGSMRIVEADATAHAPAGARLLAYFYNPFDAAVLRRVRDRLEATGGEVRVIYLNPVHADMFDAPGWTRERIAADALVARWGEVARCTGPRSRRLYPVGADT